MKMNELIYDETTINILSGLDAVRARPAMYIGSTGIEGLNQLLYEIVENSVDESLAGVCTEINLTFHRDGSCTVEDNGRGIPFAAHASNERPACEVVLTHLHAGAKFFDGAYSLSGGLHGVGLSCVNALSEWLEIDIWRDGQHFNQRYIQGVPNPETLVKEHHGKRGTKIRFLPDPTVFSSRLDSSCSVICMRLEQIAFLHPGIRIRVENHSTEQSYSFCFDTGLPGFIEHLNQDSKILHETPIHFSGKANNLEMEVALQWTESYGEKVLCFVNSIHNPQGGSHYDGLRFALLRVLVDIARAQNLLDEQAGEEIDPLDICEGLTAIVSVLHPNPEFEGQTKNRVTNAEIELAVRETVIKELSAFFTSHEAAARHIIGKIIEASRTRLAIRRASGSAGYQISDPTASAKVYQKQFGIRSSNWHDSCTWLADEELLEAHGSLCKQGDDLKLLDVCCGSGVVGNAFGNRVAHKTGFDLTAEMRALARTRLDEVHAGTVYELPFKSNTFDVACTREVFHILPQAERPVSEIFRVLRPGGQFIYGQTVPYGVADAAWCFRIFKKKQPVFFNNYLKEDYIELFQNAGFEIIEIKECLVWESIDTWINTHETTPLHRHEIRDLYYNAPSEARKIHPFEILPSGEIRDQWRWCIFSLKKPLAG